MARLTSSFVSCATLASFSCAFPQTRYLRTTPNQTKDEKAQGITCIELPFPQVLDLSSVRRMRNRREHTCLMISARSSSVSMMPPAPSSGASEEAELTVSVAMGTTSSSTTTRSSISLAKVGCSLATTLGEGGWLSIAEGSMSSAAAGRGGCSSSMAGRVSCVTPSRWSLAFTAHSHRSQSLGGVGEWRLAATVGSRPGMRRGNGEAQDPLIPIGGGRGMGRPRGGCDRRRTHGTTR
jgi:hypothetical protein